MLLLHPRHEHKFGSQILRVAKHSQYFFKHLEFLQLQGFDFVIFGFFKISNGSNGIIEKLFSLGFSSANLRLSEESVEHGFSVWNILFRSFFLSIKKRVEYGDISLSFEFLSISLIIIYFQILNLLIINIINLILKN
jgi:hypothetical protein